MTDTQQAVRVHEVTPAYWQVTLDNPPLNVVDAAIITGLAEVLDRVEASDQVRVVVFESADDEFFLAHFDMTGNSTAAARTPGRTGLPGTTDVLVRLAALPVLTIAKIRGRARGVGSEFVLACDLRYASAERAILGQPEVGAGVIPGGGSIERLAHLVGRARALEIVIGSDDYDARTAQELGYVNRAVPDAELDAFVDAFARRVASFDRRPIATAKRLVDRITLPENGHLLESQAQFAAALTWPETQKRVVRLFEKGLQQRGDFELRFGHHLNGLFDESTVD
ncbi:enoyl-CoA hydratase/isomerase family protein [Kutzneria buriramensis]|uniref:Enoyl-CoA hydratase/carnithine racemase n=1 Tax=Kutzneria buriramensis TaxID=1045776 RepID=A0A3E0GXP0_9PSEU|nr:enoyl-CoA hydratase/isomerase family protein [Kutzneria buriramensis]REH33151.1 enoyl-CoA hydratase/carnithine racemase [Kutzneria buriramensis]